MLRVIVVFLFVFCGVAVADDQLHVYYYNGETIEQMTLRNVTVTLSLQDTGRFNQLAVYVDNSSADAVNVIPANFALHQNAPKQKDLALKSEQEIQKIGGRGLWSHVAEGVGTGVKRARDKVSGQDEEASQSAPADFEAQARWLAQVNELGKRGQTGTLIRSYLRGSTVFPRSKSSGVLWFDRDDVFAAGTVVVTFGTRAFVFPFPPPASATTPAAPGKPEKLREASSDDKAVHSTGSDIPKAGVLGVSGEDWTEGTFGGVKILEVAENSAAELAGLRAGYVITEVNGKRIASANDLAVELAKREPGTRLHIVYLVRTNLGWMPQKTSVILGVAD
jgi:hypothetical protein